MEGEKIAIVYVDGIISKKTESKFTRAMKEIREDKSIKCVVLRINSPGGSAISAEKMLMNCIDLNVPVISSFSNMAASGGYYIAANCEKIFGMPTSLTGSIGVFGIRPDFSDYVRRFGINVEHVTTGEHALTNSILHPLTPKIEASINRNIDNTYEWFKKIVGIGRKMTPEEVQEIAEGRVWTGDAARSVNLIDEFGGLQKAIDYAQNKFCTSSHPEIEIWPKQKKLAEVVQQKFGGNEMESKSFARLEGKMLSYLRNTSSSSNVYLTADESTLFETFIEDIIEH